MATTTDGIEAVVLRTTRYGEADVIAQVHTLTEGSRGVIAKGARRAKSRLGARLEPLMVVRLSLVVGRSDLAVVRGVEVIAPHEHLRTSWRAQQLGASALDLVGKLGVEHEPNEAMHHLVRRCLDQLDQLAGAGALDEEQRGVALLAAFELKLLHTAGMAPQLAACVRCADTTALVAFSAGDGGVVCSTCRVNGDAVIDAQTHAAATSLTREPLAQVAAAPLDDLPALRVLRAVRGAIVAPTLLEHAGVRAR